MNAPALPPAVVEGDSYPRHGYVSPLDRWPGEDKYPTQLRGGVVTDPQRVAEIAARIRRSTRWWLR